jgi:uncharacterized pyridoxamine 5'-phosphate oxidase family protein
MRKLSDDIIKFFHSESFTIVSTVDEDGTPHNSCKGIVDIEASGKIYLLDLYKQRTYENLKRNNLIALTAVNEHRFTGYCLKGKGRIVKDTDIEDHIMKAWEKKITSRITSRVLKNIKGEKGHPKHPEMLLPTPEYLIEMEVDKIIDLTPHAMRP